MLLSLPKLLESYAEAEKEIIEMDIVRIAEKYTQRRIYMNNNGFTSEHWDDENGNPCGGITEGVGFTISWQNGPLRTNNRNGAFVEDVIKAVIDRMEYYEASKFSCPENVQTISALKSALLSQIARTQRRTEAGIEGTHAEDDV